MNQLQFNMIANHNAFDNIIWTALSGNNNMLLTPKVIDTVALSQIVKNLTTFRDLIYRNDPNLLYSTAIISLVDISYDLTTAHFTLSFPTVYKNTIPMNLYKVNQVGMFTHHDQCTYRSVPKYLAQNHGRFQAIDSSNCVSHNNIRLCQPQAIENITSCLQANHCSCGYQYSKCSENYRNKKYVISLAGILLRNNLKGSTFARYRNRSIVPIKLTKYHTAFVNWTDILEVQINHV